MRGPSSFRRGGVMNKLMNLLFTGGLIAIAVYFYVNRDKTPTASDIAEKAQQEPETALRHYLETAYHFMHQEQGGNFDDVKLTVTADDWEWFQKHADELMADPFNVRSGVDPTTAGALSRRVGLMNLFNAGPNRGDCEITSPTLSGSEATYTLKYKSHGDEEFFYTYEVKLVKEDNLWKMSDWGGARSKSGI